MEEKKTWGNWLAIASFILALVWGFFCITLFLLPLWVLCLILALIFGIIALCKKQTKRASILWIIFSILWIAIVVICTTVISKFVVQHKDDLINPITEFSEWIEANPEIAELMENEEFSNKYEEAIRQRLQEKYGEDFSDIDSIDGIMDIWWDMFEEMKNVATELAEQEGVNSLIPVNLEETPAEITVCDEFYKSGEEIVCTEQYEPVCGDNGQTYGNSCFACIEVDSYTNGECDTTEIEPVEVEPVVEE